MKEAQRRMGWVQEYRCSVGLTEEVSRSRLMNRKVMEKGLLMVLATDEMTAMIAEKNIVSLTPEHRKALVDVHL
jgi:hypothetical protein